MKYNIELISSTEHYQVSDVNDKKYRVDAYFEENVGWENDLIFDDETDKDITETELGKEILKEFKNR